MIQKTSNWLTDIEFSSSWSQSCSRVIKLVSINCKVFQDLTYFVNSLKYAMKTKVYQMMMLKHIFLKCKFDEICVLNKLADLEMNTPNTCIHVY